MLIGISGHKGVGKNVVANFLKELHPFEEKMFANKLKDMTCVLLGCTREQLEDWEFKEAPIPYLGNKTPRDIMQLLGTEFGRMMIYQNVWVNSLMAGYTPDSLSYGTIKGEESYDRLEDNYYWVTPKDPRIPKEHWGRYVQSENIRYEIKGFPDWVITDVRFRNEATAIKDRKGYLIRVERDLPNQDLHSSETALDDYTGWDFTIHNDLDLEHLRKLTTTVFSEIQRHEYNRSVLRGGSL